MTIKIYDDELTDLLSENAYPDPFFSTGREIKEKTTYLEHATGKGYYREIYFDGFHIGFGNAFFSRRLLLSYESDFETVEMHFTLKGKSTTFSEKFDKKVCFESNHHNIIYAKNMSGEMQLADNAFQICEINLSPEFFKKFLPEDTEMFDKFRNSMEKGDSRLLGSHNNHISHQMYQIIKEIMACERKGCFKKMFLEAKVIELLLLQFEQFSEENLSNRSLNKADIDKMYAVRDYILSNINNSCSLIELAHQVGTNEFTLKKGFKEIFGTTVFGFWNNIKMDYAKSLILDQNMNIAEVSFTLGYKNQRHFSTAFKRRYGLPPSHLKNKSILKF